MQLSLTNSCLSLFCRKYSKSTSSSSLWQNISPHPSLQQSAQQKRTTSKITGKRKQQTEMGSLSCAILTWSPMRLCSASTLVLKMAWPQHGTEYTSANSAEPMIFFTPYYILYIMSSSILYHTMIHHHTSFTLHSHTKWDQLSIHSGLLSTDTLELHTAPCSLDQTMTSPNVGAVFPPLGQSIAVTPSTPASETKMCHVFQCSTSNTSSFWDPHVTHVTPKSQMFWACHGLMALEYTECLHILYLCAFMGSAC